MSETTHSNDKTALSAIDKFSAEQEAALIEHERRWREPVQTCPPQRQETEAALAHLYEDLKLAPPQVVWCQSPWQLVLAHGMYRLRDIHGQAETYAALSEEIKSPLFKHLWQRLIDCDFMANVQNNDVTGNGDDGEPRDSFGYDLNTDIKTGVSQILEDLEKKLSEELTLPLKLKMRQVFRRRLDGDPDWMGMRPRLFRAQWGLIYLRGLLADSLSSEFCAQISDEMRTKLNAICKERLKADRTMHFFPRQYDQPMEGLFSAADESLSQPGDMGQLGHISFVLKHLPVERKPEMRSIFDWTTLKENVFHIDAFEKICFLCELPTESLVNERGQLHNDSGPAMRFADGFEIYAINGVVIPKDAMMASAKLTVDQIDKEQNVEVRRILIQRYGMERYLKDSSAVEIDSDEFGVLYKKSLHMDEPIVVVRVLNPTPEPDGTRKYYFLRVPPYMTSAKAAVAWTFNMSPEEYQPADQS